MDLQTFLISIVIFIVSALLIWLITSLTVRERPFEERLEEQRKMEKALMLLGGKQAGVKKDKPKKKTKKLKSGERDGVEMASEKMENVPKAKTTKMVELEIDPEVIETSLSEPPLNITEKKSKPGKQSAPGSPTTTVKPILVNKEEKSHVHKSEKATELFHRRVHKDEVELKHDRQQGRKVDSQNIVTTPAVNGFHSESTADVSDDLPTVVTQTHADHVKAPVNDSRSKKQRLQLDSLSTDGGMSQFSTDRTSKRKPVSNDVSVSGRGI